MDLGDLILRGSVLWSPIAFAGMIGLAILLVWLALAPSRPRRETEERLDGYLDRVDIIEAEMMQQSLARRTVLPLVRRTLGIVGRVAPRRNVEATQTMLVQAGEPAGLSALDFYGLRLLLALLLGAGYFLLMGNSLALPIALRNTLLLGAAGYFLPALWLRRRVRQRQHEIARALPDALDMMTVGVEAGLAFESAMLKVGDRWDNALTRELQRAVAEMRVGTSRDEALQRMVGRTGVLELATFVAVLIQSHRMGVSIAQVLHTQADLMRERRRQRSEELARQAGVKMVFPLIFLIFPAVMIVILGPSIPIFRDFLRNIVPTITGGGP